MDLPYVGPLFSLRNDQVDRTELIVLIAPRVLHDRQDADDATEELEEKLPLLRDSLPAPRR
jgi:general secretion pathway protein D